MAKGNGKVEGRDPLMLRISGAVGINDRDAYVLQNTPTILAAMLIRRQSTSGNILVDEAISCAQRIWDVVHEMDVPAEAMMSQPVDVASDTRSTRHGN